VKKIRRRIKKRAVIINDRKKIIKFKAHHLKETQEKKSKDTKSNTNTCRSIRSIISMLIYVIVNVIIKILFNTFIL
jgi:hypothetical protein